MSPAWPVRRWELPAGDPLTMSAWLVGFAALALPTLWRLAGWVWPSDDQGHGPIILAVSLALLGRAWPELARLPSGSGWGWGLIVPSLLVYAIGRSQAILMGEVAALIGALAGLIVLTCGAAGLRRTAFPLLFLLFMVPLPEALVAAVTAPMKSAVSQVATGLLQTAGWPVARTGVMIHAGPYQLLVADACAGLNTLFTLEALGLLYLHLRGSAAPLRRALLALLVVPISFAANVLRVVTLVVITLRFGDAVGRGYAHDAAGFVLMGTALVMMLLADAVMGWALRPRTAGAGQGAAP